VDRGLLAAIFGLMIIGAILVTASSPPVAERLSLQPYHFVERHQIFLLMGVAVMLIVSFLSTRLVRTLSLVGLAGSLFLMVLLPWIGLETKGASRWISLGGFSIQPSEFMKPCFAITIAWIFAQQEKIQDFPSYRLSILLFGITAGLLMIQPDFGMTVTVAIIWGVQLFLAGLPIIWIFLLVALGICGAIAAYFMFSHVQERIERFLNPQSGDNYQVEKSLEAFRNGGILGKGPGEGEVKLYLPDSHTDFIFAVAGEEFGLLFCLAIIALFALVIYKSFKRLLEEDNLFNILAVAGIVTQFGTQALINMGVAIQLLPAKGMTLPFLSYGGSSVMATALAMGFLLALTRKRFGEGLRRGTLR
jgi:cell division protein FtsW